MTIPVPRGRSGRVGGVVVRLLAALVLGAGIEVRPGVWTRAQVTVFGIVAVPNQAMMDPKLKAIAPNCAACSPTMVSSCSTSRASGSRPDRPSVANSGGAAAATTLMMPLDDNGKVQLRCELLQNEVSQVATMVATPPNQLFFCDKARPDGSRILIGIGA